MAYAFKRIEDALGQGSEGSIFGQTGEGTEDQGMMRGQGASGVKTTTSGDLGPQTQVSGSTRSGVSSSYNPEYQSDQNVVAANIGKTNVARGGVQSIQDQLQQNQQRLQDEANRYKQDVREAETYDTSEQTLQKAVEGDEDAFKTTQDVMTAGEYVRPEFEMDQDLRVEDVDLLQNQAGLQKLASRGQDPRYTQGMAAFDAMLMQRDPEFQRMVNETRAADTAFRQDLAAQPDTLEAWAQDYGTRARDTARDTAEQYLQNYLTGLEEQNVAERDQYAQTLADLDREQVQGQALDRAIADIMPDLEQAAQGASLDRFLSQSGVDPSQFISYQDAQGLDYRDFVDETEAQRFNRIAQLMGGGELYEAGGLPNVSDAYTVDRRGLENRLFENIMDARNQASIEQENKIRDILQGAAGRRDVLNERLAGMRGTYDEDLRQLANEILYQNKPYAEFFDDQMIADYGGPTFADLTTDDVLTQSDVNRLNVASADLGRDPIYQRGARGLPETLIDRQGFHDYLLGRLEDAYANRPIPEAALAPYERELTGQGRAVENARGALDYYGRRGAERVGNLSGGGSPFNRIMRAI